MMRVELPLRETRPLRNGLLKDTMCLGRALAARLHMICALVHTIRWYTTS